MDIAVRSGDALGQATPLLVLGTWEDEALQHAVDNLVEAEDWTAGPRRCARSSGAWTRCWCGSTRSSRARTAACSTAC